ncbi:hypothetical protein V1512DRAFT_248249 [Lipomyces arxii]|uniref:uncharacterized protein n=1 Tax=Lipomyces arxii TaxID=56418 RepID=UPI0034CF0490
MSSSLFRSSTRIVSRLIKVSTTVPRNFAQPFVLNFTSQNRLFARGYATPDTSQVSDAILNSAIMQKLSSDPEVMECIANTMLILKEKGFKVGSGQPSAWQMLKLIRDEEVKESMVTLKYVMDKKGIEITKEEALGLVQILAGARK